MQMNEPGLQALQPEASAWPPAEALAELAGLLRSSGYRFVTPTPATHARVVARPGHALARDLAGVFGWSRPFDATTVPPALLTAMARADVLERDGARLRSRVRFSSLAGELFAHSAYPTLSDDAVFFGPDTYRFANALLAWMAASRAPVRRAVDVGCGSGAAGILIAREHPDAQVTLVDINGTALAVAQANAIAAGTPNAIPRRSDLLDAVDGEFDLIVANPPYLVDASARTYRHGGGELGAALSEAIVGCALERLAPGGTLLLYTGVAIVDGTDPFRSAVAPRLDAADVDWIYDETDPDVFGEELVAPPYDRADRIAAVVLVATRRTGA